MANLINLDQVALDVVTNKRFVAILCESQAQGISFLSSFLDRVKQKNIKASSANLRAQRFADRVELKNGSLIRLCHLHDTMSYRGFRADHVFVEQSARDYQTALIAGASLLNAGGIIYSFYRGGAEVVQDFTNRLTAAVTAKALQDEGLVFPHIPKAPWTGGGKSGSIVASSARSWYQSSTTYMTSGGPVFAVGMQASVATMSPGTVTMGRNRSAPNVQTTSGPVFPLHPETGDLHWHTGVQGLYVFDGSQWIAASKPRGRGSVDDRNFAAEHWRTLVENMQQMWLDRQISQTAAEKVNLMLDMAANILEEMDRLEERGASAAELTGLRKKIDGLFEYLDEIPEDRRTEFEDLLIIADDRWHHLHS